MRRAIDNVVIDYFMGKVMYEAREHRMIFGEDLTKKYISHRVRELYMDALENGALCLVYGMRDEKTGEKIEIVTFEKTPEDFEDFVDI